MKHTTIGLDIAKNVFHIVGIDSHNNVLLKKKLSRRKVLKYFANLPTANVVMEECETPIIGVER